MFWDLMKAPECSCLNLVQLLDFYAIELTLKMPVQTDRFRASDCGKQELHKISREYFENVVKNEQMKIVLSGYLHSDTILNNCVRLRLSKFSNQLNQDVLQE